MSTSAIARRARYGLLSAVLIAAALVSTVLVNVLAGKFPRRFDVTATGEHRLSPRSALILKNLPGESQVVVVGALGSIDAHAKDDVRDVLRTFAQDSGGKFTWRMIDVATSRGQDDAAALLAELVAHDTSQAGVEKAKVEAVVRTLDKAALDVETSLSPGIQRFLKLDITANADPKAKDAFANILRAGDEIARWPAQWKTLGGQALTELARKESGLQTPAPGQAARLVADDLSGKVLVLVSLEGQLRTLAGLVKESTDFLTQFADSVRARREFIDSIAEACAAVKTLDSEAALRRLRQSGTVLMLAPGKSGGGAGGVRSIELSDLFSPRGEQPGASATRASVRRNAESVIARELAAVVAEHPPIVVLMTAEAAVGGRRLRLFDGTRALLRERGIDVIEWDVAETPQRPDVASIDPRSQRPVVWLARFPDNSRASGGDGERSGLDRARMLGEETAKLAAEGKNLLICVGPSIVPVDKEPDPADGVLGRFGLSVRSDRVVMDQTFVGNRQVVRADLLARATGEEKPIVGAVRGLPLLMPWPVPIVKKESQSPSWSVAEIGGSTAWLEADWRAFKSVPRDRREQVSDPPTYTGGKDERDGPWSVIAAAEKPGASGTQRMVAVGSNDWLSFAEAVWSAQRQGRAGPGDIAAAQASAELLESAVQWLAGHDELVAQGVESRATPLIQPIAESRLMWLKILLMAGLPVLVLVVGMLSRVVMG